MSRFEDAIPVILRHEGGWVNDPEDSGGETNFGWSMRTILQLNLTPAELGLDTRDFYPGCLKKMTESTAKKLYRTHFWDRNGYGNVVDQTVATKIMDASVNCGPRRAAEFAQKAANALGAALAVDGALGAKSWAAINQCDPVKYAEAYRDQMMAFYNSIVARKPSQQKFMKSWSRRANWGVQTSLGLKLKP